MYLRICKNKGTDQLCGITAQLIIISSFALATYSKTCLGRPPLGRTKCGLSRQVVSEARESRKLEISLIFIV